MKGRIIRYQEYEDKQNPIDRGGHFTQMVDLTRGILWISPKVRFLL